MQLYFKYLNNYGYPLGEWWVYSKVIFDNKDRTTCQVFRFQKTSRQNNPQYNIGLEMPFFGDLDTNKYAYYEDLCQGSECTKEEFELELKKFMSDLNSYVDFLNYSP